MISVKGLSITAGEFVLRNVVFHVPQGEYGVLMGRTGCGKTTVLEAICGLKKINSGQIVLRDLDVTWLPVRERDIGYVPQDGALFSNITVAEHLAFGPTIHRWSRADCEKRVTEMAELLGISHLLNRRPHGLSGGERQRVALGRALSFKPNILLLDEPLSALDDETRVQMYELLKRVQRHEHVTALHVTHSREEAAALGDRLLRFVDGKVLDETTKANDKEQTIDTRV